MTELIPIPRSISGGKGKFVLQPSTVIMVPMNHREIPFIGQFLADRLRPATGFDLPVRHLAGSSQGNIVMKLDEAHSDPGSEGYDLKIEPGGIQLLAAHPAGLFHGVQTILQCLPPKIEKGFEQPGPWEMDCVHFRDFPQFTWRGAMLDVARHFFDATAVKRLIDQLAFYKFNILHLHLTDDSGWRIKINSWPRLTEVGSTTDFTSGSGGYYSQEEYRQIVAYAAARYITIVPEVDMPAHINSALASYAELNENGTATTLSPGMLGESSSLAIHKEITYKFLEDVLGEISALTPGPFLHIGGDEAMSTPEEDYKIFINRVLNMVHGLGKRSVGWEEIIHADTLPDTILQHWLQMPLAQTAASRGQKLILSPAFKIYLDMKYDPSTPIGLDWIGKPLEVQEAYDWDPLQFLEEVPGEAILGVEAPLWTETVTSQDEMDYMFFPRLVGCAEIGWSGSSKGTWEDYRSRLASHGPRLENRGIHFYHSPQVDWK